MYVNYGYYESKYLLGREPTVPEDDFLFWEKQTERILNQYTFGRLNADTGLLSDEVKIVHVNSQNSYIRQIRVHSRS